MKSLKKLALVSAMVAASSSAFAMEAMDEEALAAATGQDGLLINLNVAMTDLDIKWIDRTGTSVGAYTNAGGVVINNVDVTVNDLDISIDAGGDVGDTTGDGLLHVNINAGGATIIGLDGTTIGVADADATGSATGTEATIISFGAGAALNIAAGMDIDIELGNEVNNFMSMTASLPSISLTNLQINDAGGAFTGGSIFLGNLGVSSLNVVAAVDIVAGGLRIDTTGTTIGEVALEQVRLGTNAAANQIGDIYIQNLTANNVITVSGKP